MVTGGIASGKSTVLREWESRGVSVAYADAIARDVFESEPVIREIEQKLGSTDRGQVRSAIASDPEFRHWLNALTHPLILKGLKESRAQALEIPLLMEACLWSIADAVVVTWCPLDVVRPRVRKRGLSNSEIEGVLAAQVHPDARLPFADAILRTNSSLERVLADARELADRFF